MRIYIKYSIDGERNNYKNFDYIENLIILPEYNDIYNLKIWYIDILKYISEGNTFKYPINLERLEIHYPSNNYSLWNVDPERKLEAIPEGIKTCKIDFVDYCPKIPDSVEFLLLNGSLDFCVYNLPPNLKFLNCGGPMVHYNGPHLVSIKSLPESLKVLYCQRGKLTSLPKLPSGLKRLDCDTNELEELPELPEGLQSLFCFNNKLKKLPKLPKSLRYLNCTDNKLVDLPLSVLYCDFSDYEDHMWGSCRYNSKRNFHIGHVNFDKHLQCDCKVKMLRKYKNFMYQQNPVFDMIKKIKGRKNKNGQKLKKY